MPVKRTSNTAKVLAKIERVGEGCMIQILAVIQANAQFHAPLDTGALQNSAFRVVERMGDGWRGRIGYTVAYAAYLHGDDVSTPLWKPRKPKDRSQRRDPETGAVLPGKSGGYNPNAHPRWLERAAEDSRDGIQRIIKANYGSI
jgi:hypothetical protein